MSIRDTLRRKMVFPITIIRRNGEEKQLAHTLDVTEISARLGGIGVPLQPGEIIEIQRGGVKAKFRVYWMGAVGTDLEGQAGVRGLDSLKSIWSIHLPADEPDIAIDTFLVRGKPLSSRTSVATPSEQESVRYTCSAGATLRAPGSNYPVRVQIKNIHLNGLFAETVVTLPLKTVVSLELQLEGIAVETAGVVVSSMPRVGMEISFHRVSPETKRKIVLALQKLKQKTWDEQQVPLPQNIPAPRSASPAAPSVMPTNGVDASRALVAICKILSADFDEWKLTRTAVEIEELRKAVTDLQQKLTPAAAIDIGEYLASSVPNRGGQA
ncbi:MAG TPA: PilZ domain-containing protein [Candidatus Angelobacter sp.]|nr:PilZ domain-containing protein [Candidatus Angelobacter sp.]